MKVNEFDTLLIEDNAADAELTIRGLKKRDLANKVIVLNDGAKALEFIFATGEYSHRNANAKPKLILLDLKLPKVDGLEILHKIKSDDKTKIIPVVVLTSSKTEKDIIESYKLGVNSYIVKPMDFDKFVEAIEYLGLYWLLLNKPSV